MNGLNGLLTATFGNQVFPPSMLEEQKSCEVVLSAALRVSNQTTSIRPFGATESVPNQCHFEWLTGSSLIRRGALNVRPASVLRANITSLPLLKPDGCTLAST